MLQEMEVLFDEEDFEGEFEDEDGFLEDEDEAAEGGRAEHTKGRVTVVVVNIACGGVCMLCMHLQIKTGKRGCIHGPSHHP